MFTACGDCLARCFDSRTGTLLREFKGHEGIVTNVQVARVLPPVTHAWTVVKRTRTLQILVRHHACISLMMILSQSFSHFCCFFPFFFLFFFFLFFPSIFFFLHFFFLLHFFFFIFFFFFFYIFFFNFIFCGARVRDERGA